MSGDAFVFPDVLVLAAGGVVGEAWMTGVLAGLEEAAGVDFREAQAFVGTSAGSIVAASLAAGRRPRRPPREGAGTRAYADRAREEGALRRAAGAWARGVGAATAPLAGPLLALNAPGGAVARSWLLGRVPGSGRSLAALRREVDGWGARFDGRLHVATVDRASGRRVVFGRDGAPRATVGEAVAASCSVPWIFSPVRIGDREYVDGGAWSITNLDVAPAGRGSEVLCLSVTASASLALTSPRSALRAALRVNEAGERLALEGRGARVRTIGPDGETAGATGADLMDQRRAPAALAAGYRQGLELPG
jgi:NTE family protein